MLDSFEIQSFLCVTAVKQMHFTKLEARKFEDRTHMSWGCWGCCSMMEWKRIERGYGIWAERYIPPLVMLMLILGKKP